MTKDQILAAVRKYDGWLQVYPAERLPTSLRTPVALWGRQVDGLAVEKALGHVRWMCHEVETFVAERPDKANRWLGFIQGVLWFTGIATIDALKDDNR